MKFKNLGEVKNRIQCEDKLFCMACNSSLANSATHHEDHSGGEEIDEFKERQWVTFKCLVCGHLSSYKQLIQRRPPF